MAKFVDFYSLDAERFQAKCKLCVETTIIKYSASSKTNLKTHIEGFHRHATAEQKAAAIGTGTVAAAFKGPPVFSNQEAITNTVCDMIIDLHLPVSIIEKPSFRKVLAVASKNLYKPICYKTMRDRIIKNSNWIFNFAEYEREFRKPSATVDIWSSRKRRGYMAISLHCQTKSGLDTKVLDFVHIPSPHTGENIKLTFDKVLAEHGLAPTDIFKIVCDNASNMKKAFRVSIWETNEDEDEENEDDIDDPDAVSDIDVHFDDLFQDQFRRPCSIHTIQLLVKDCLEAIPAKYKQVIEKAKAVCRKQHMSTKISEAMSAQLPAPGETRWNGQYRLLVKIEENWEDVKQKIGLFVDSDIPFLRSIIKFLKPFYDLTKRLEYEKISTVQDVIPLLCKLERDITNCGMPAPFVQDCLHALERRFGFICEDPHLLSATVLSSHGFKWLNIAREKNVFLKFDTQDKLLSVIKGYLGNLIDEATADLIDRTSTAERPAKFQKVSESLFGYEEVPENDEAVNWAITFDQHLLRTTSLSTTVDASAYWLSQPKSALQKVALMILAVPASSAPVERIFSHAGLVCSPKRTSMKDDLLAALVKAKYNSL